MGPPRPVGARRTHVGYGIAALVALLVSVCVTALSAAVFALSPGREVAQNASFLPVQPGAVAWSPAQPLRVLLFTVDGRSRVQQASVLQYSPVDRSLGLLSIPSALWIRLPDSGQVQLSNVYASAGPARSLLSIEALLQIPISYYAIAHDDVIERFIDMLGGVRLSSARGQAAKSNELSGRAALYYVRGRNFTAMQKGQQLQIALFRSLAEPHNMVQLPAIVDALGGFISTNIPYRQMPGLLDLMARARVVHTSMLSPENQTLTTYSGWGGTSYVPDLPHIRLLTHSLFRLEVAPTVPVSVLNGSGLAGQATALARWLRQLGIPEVQASLDATSNYSQTQVAVPSSHTPTAMSTARTLASLLQVPLIVHDSRRGMRGVQVIIGKDFINPSG